jgi:4-amino-4-deoxy-L-arabinose transferase-like glycosyltransferase
LIRGLVLAVYLLLAVGYATATPIWQNPDEPAHYNYIAQVAETGTLPELRAGDWDLALLSRLQNGQLGPNDSIQAIRYESWQPPLYYLAAAPIYRLGAADDAARVLRLRLFGVVLGGLTLVLGYLIARSVLAESLALAVPLTMAGVPMFTAVSASVSADPLANALAAVLVLVLVRGLNGVAQPARTGVVLGLGGLAKLALVVFGPLALWIVLTRSRRPVRDAALLIGCAVLVLLPWLVHQVTTYGWFDPLATARHAAVVTDQPRFDGFTAGYVVDFLTITFHSFWAQFGWMAIPAPDRLYWLWGALTLLAVAGLVWRRDWLDQPAWRLLLVTVLAAFIAYIAYNLAFKQFQGRYLFTALVPMCSLLVLGWATWLPRRLQAAGAFAIGLVLVGLNAYALTRILMPGFAPAG